MPNFGAGGNFSIICIEGDVKQEQTQQALLQAHERLEREKGITHVLSLKNAQVFMDAGGFMESTNLFENGKVTNPRLWTQVFESPLYTGNLVSKTGLASSVVFQLEATDGNQAQKDRFIEAGAQKITDDLQRQYPDLKFISRGRQSLKKKLFMF